jgi:hypothetical protein
VIAVRVVQVTADQVVDVRSVRDRLMTAVRSVLVSGAVLGALVAERAVSGVGVADRERVALDAALVVVVQLAVVKMIDMIAVADGRVATAGAVLVVMRVAGHAVTSLPQVIS